MIRNLIVHCYPRKSGMWRRAVRHLMAGNRWSQFNGKRIVTVAIDDCCDDPWMVAQEFGHDANMDIEFIERDNDKKLQEVASFSPMMEIVESNRHDEFTTYIHCKGCTQPENHGSHGWLDFMATANLDYPELVRCCFESGANLVGAFRSHGLWDYPGYHSWHFAGTWFTFRHSRIFGETNWRNIHQDFMGVEAWPGIVPVEESRCLFFDNANTGHLYSPEFQKEIIRPAMNYWKRSLKKQGLRPLCENPPDYDYDRQSPVYAHCAATG